MRCSILSIGFTSALLLAPAILAQEHEHGESEASQKGQQIPVSEKRGFEILCQSHTQILTFPPDDFPPTD